MHACVLIGVLPTGQSRLRSFELFRHNLKDVVVVTFDELLRKVADLCSFLEGKGEAFETPDEQGKFRCALLGGPGGALPRSVGGYAERPGAEVRIGRKERRCPCSPMAGSRAENPRAVDNWRSAVEAHGNQPNSASRVLKTGCDLIGVREALDGEETLPRVVQVRKPGPAPAGSNYVDERTGYGTRRAASHRVSGGSRLRLPRSTQT